MTWQPAARTVIDDWDRSGIVTSPDVDGLLSAALLASAYGSRVIGVYTTTSLLLFDGATPSDARDAMWLDHDISHTGVRCIGQHLVLHSAQDTLPRRHTVTFNPNLHYRQTFRDSFKGKAGRTRDKYPFATIHFLMPLLGVDAPKVGTTAFGLLAHADGAWATPLDYPANCGIWHELMFDDRSMTHLLVNRYTQSETSLAKHLEVVTRLREQGIDARRSRVAALGSASAPWAQLEGNQSISYRRTMDRAVFMERLRGVAGYIGQVTEWRYELPRTISDVITGNVETPFPNSIAAGGFDSFMNANEIFSHAFTNFRTLRFTRNIYLA